MGLDSPGENASLPQRKDASRPIGLANNNKFYLALGLGLIEVEFRLINHRPSLSRSGIEKAVLFFSVDPYFGASLFQTVYASGSALIAERHLEYSRPTVPGGACHQRLSAF